MTVRPEYRALVEAHTAAEHDYAVVAPDRVRELALSLRPGLAPPPKATPIPVAEVRTEELGDSGLLARVYRPAVDGALPVLIYVHGGGWIGGSLESVDENARIIANQAECLVVNVEYRLAPEHPYPAAVDDVWRAIDWVRHEAARLGGDPARIALAGNSAGGNLVAAATLRARSIGAPTFVAQLLIYPVLDAAQSSPSFGEVAAGPFLGGPQMAFFWRAYLGRQATAADLADPELSPLGVADLAGLPPAVIVTAEEDPLRDEAEQYARRLADAGVPVTWRRYAGQVHGFMTMSQLTGEAHHATVEVAYRLKAAFRSDRAQLQQAWDAPGWS